MKTIKNALWPVLSIVLLITKIFGLIALSWGKVIGLILLPIIFAVLYAIAIFIFYAFKNPTNDSNEAN